MTTGHPRGPVDALTIKTPDLGQSYEVFTVERGKEFPYTNSGGETETGTSSLGNNTVAVDSENPERVYRSFRFRTRGPDLQGSGQPDRPRLAVSNDGGQSWADSIDPFDQLGDDVYGGDLPMLAAGPEGVVYGFTRERVRRAPEGQTPPRQRIFMSKSTDGGATWATSVAFDDADDLSDPGVAVNPTNGDVYVVFESMTDNGTEHVFFMSSADEGANWSQPVDIIDQGGQAYNQSVPGISVAPDGRLDVAWYDFRNDPFFTPDGTVTQRYSDVYSASSTDGGRTWSDNLRVSDRSSDRSIGATFDNEDVRGPLGIASTEKAALITWADSRAGALPEFDVEDAYFTRVVFATASDGSGLDGASALAGVGAALAVVGVVLLAATRGRAGPTPEDGEAHRA